MHESNIPCPCWREIVRRSGRESIVCSDPLDQGDSYGVSIEYIASPGFDARYVCLCELAGRAFVVRREIQVTRVNDRLCSIPQWEGTVPCSSQLIRREMWLLERMGLWELGDFRAQDVIDGYTIVLRARDPCRNRLQVVCLYCPEVSENRQVRKVANRLCRITVASEQTFRFRSWLCSVLPMRLA